MITVIISLYSGCASTLDKNVRSSGSMKPVCWWRCWIVTEKRTLKNCNIFYFIWASNTVFLLQGQSQIQLVPSWCNSNFWISCLFIQFLVLVFYFLFFIFMWRIVCATFLNEIQSIDAQRLVCLDAIMDFVKRIALKNLRRRKEQNRKQKIIRSFEMHTLRCHHLPVLLPPLSATSRRIHKRQWHTPLPCRPSKRQTHRRRWLGPIHLLPNLISMCRPTKKTHSKMKEEANADFQPEREV